MARLCCLPPRHLPSHLKMLLTWLPSPRMQSKPLLMAFTAFSTGLTRPRWAGYSPSLPPTSCRHHAAASTRCVPGPCPPSTALFLLLHPPTTPCPTAAPSAGAVGAIL